MLVILHIRRRMASLRQSARRAGAPVAVMAIAVCLTTVAACGGSDAAGDAGGDAAGDTTGSAQTTSEPVRIAAFGPIENGYTNVILEGIEEGAARVGDSVRIFDTGFDAAKQYTQVEDAIASGRYQALVIFPLAATNLIALVERAADAGITIIALNNALGPDLAEVTPQVPGVVASVMEDQVNDEAKVFAETTALACADKDPCNFLYISGAPAFDLDKLVTASMKEFLAEYPNIKLLAVGDGKGFSESGAYETAQDMLQANPDVDVFGANGDQMALGVALAVEQAGLSDQVKIWGAGASCRGIEALEAGTLFATSLNLPRSMGLIAAELAGKAVRGEDVPEWVAPSKEAAQPKIITQDTLLEDFECEWVGS